TISVIDVATRTFTRGAIPVGPHPSALALRGTDLYVALAGANGVVRVDLRTRAVAERLTVALSPQAPTGSDPNALALAPDGRTLYVAMAGNNAVAVVRRGPTGMELAGLIPVGWYPTAVAVAANGRTLYVANGKGNSAAANRDGTYIARLITGTVSLIPIPDAATLGRYTREVYASSPYSNPRVRAVSPDRLGAAPPVRHVVYVVRENRTYDQVFGDVRAGNGDSGLALFNDSVTPNAHAIARRWVLFDNFYVNGEVSANGHEWTDRAFSGDYNEKTWPQNYSHRRPWDFDDGEDLVNPHGAYLWDAARRKGLWVVNFGERAETDSTGNTHTALAGLDEVTVHSYPAFRLEIPDTLRARLVADSIASWDRQGRFPDLVLIWLPRDHTYGRAGGRPTPRSMVAENDLALGRIVERLSISPTWASLALFALEDDAQDGPDHVDAHRSVLLVASPWARRGVVDSTFYTTSAVVRSIELLLGLPALSQYDSAATPLWAAFASQPLGTPYASLPNTWPLDELNPHAYRSTIPARDFVDADRADEVALNREIWESVHPRWPLRGGKRVGGSK
ncbi:MAG TPA: beta-propeller fold lactonase family protein, partial [Gemmatimonadales bacterium]|nr:beta-propeller fold lactonase family protein [Gemmatimonadales bacterium]